MTMSPIISSSKFIRLKQVTRSTLFVSCFVLIHHDSRVIMSSVPYLVWFLSSSIIGISAGVGNIKHCFSLLFINICSGFTTDK